MRARELADAFSERIVRRRGIVAFIWLVACLTILPGARRIESRLRVAARVDGSESATVEEQLSERFQSPFAHSVVLVATGIPSPVDASGVETLRALVDSVRAAPGVTRVLSYVDGHEPLFVGADAHRTEGTFLVVGLDERRAPDLLLDSLRHATTRIAAAMRRDYPSVALRWTGEVALNTDIRRVSADGARRAESRALPLTFALLLVAFGAIAAALLPVIGALLSIGITLGIAGVVATHWSLSILLQNVVSMIGLGLGIDYALLIIQRFRQSADGHRLSVGARQQAIHSSQCATEALRTAGPTILLSGTAVAIGFSALAIVPVNELRSVAVGGLIVTIVSMLLATTLLPGVLATLGGRVEIGRIPLARRRRDIDWSRWAAFVTRHPGRVLVVAGLPVALLAWQARRLETVQPRSAWLPKQAESAIALHTLETMGRSAVVQTIRVTIELPAGTSAVDDSGWTATARLARRLVTDSAVDRVRSLPGLLAPLAGTLPRDLLLAELPEPIRRSFVSRDGRLALLEVIPREGTSPAELASLVRRIRAAEPPLATTTGRARIWVGGLPALNIDYEEAVAGQSRFTQVVALVLLATFVVLALGFRSVLVPLKAIVLNLVAVAGAFGAVKLVFQDGYGVSLLGVASPLGGIFPAIPVLVFCVVFGLSMDYEVFLVARVREARVAGRDERVAIADGLAHTGRLITSAAAIMIVVFGAFMAGDFLLMKMLGFALAVSVLLDATVMRLAVSPALLALAGRWNWWPGDRRTARAPATVPPGRVRATAGRS